MLGIGIKNIISLTNCPGLTSLQRLRLESQWWRCHPKPYKQPHSIPNNTSNQMEQNTVWERAQIAVRAPWRIQTSSEQTTTAALPWCSDQHHRTLHRYCFSFYLCWRLSFQISFHLQPTQDWQACKGSILNHSDGIVIQMPTSKQIPSKQQKTPTSSKWKKTRYARCTDSS